MSCVFLCLAVAAGLSTLTLIEVVSFRTLRKSNQMLHHSGGRGRSANRGLGENMSSLKQASQGAKLQLKADNDRGKLERSRAHLLRMQASDDTEVARADLDRVVSLDKQLASIKQEAITTRSGFGTASGTIMASAQDRTKLIEDAARVTSQVKALRAKISKLVEVSHADKIKAAEDKDEEDTEQEQLSSALVRRNRREKRVEEERRRLDRLQLQYNAADIVAAQKLKFAESEYKAAQDDLSQLQNQFGEHHAAIVRKDISQLKPLLRKHAAAHHKAATAQKAAAHKKLMKKVVHAAPKGVKPHARHHPIHKKH